MNDATLFTQEDIELLLSNLDTLSAGEIDELYKIVDDLSERQRLQKLRDDLIAFCCHMQADYKVGAHHRRLADLLEDIEASRKDRICVSVPPRHGKSQLVSIYYAAWYIGRNPTHKIMLVSHTTDLAVDFGRKIRNLIATEAYREVFPDVQLASDSKSAGRWNTNQGGEFFAAGVGSALAGRGAHLLLVDDPHSEQDVLNGNYEVFSKAYEWFTFGARTRLMPGGRVAIVHCMTGDTGVLRPDGTETPLRDIRAGDMIASYDRGRLVGKTVLNWANQGPDHIYSIRLNNNLIRANARHPFLVVRDGVETWVKVRDLRVGDSLVSLKGVAGSPNQTAPQASATCLYPATGQSQCSSGQFTTSEIISITHDGVEDVFDIQVEDTENFIANGVVSHNTRWHMDDLIGRVTRDMMNNDDADQYEVFEFPAILTVTDPDTGNATEKALWPEFFDLPALRRTKASMPVFQWNAQYQQSPTSEEAAIIKREWWRKWERDQPPPCDYIIASLDAAAETHNRADYTALTLWGIFLNEDEDHHQLILLHSIKDRFEFPELKRLALDIYRDWEPDSFIVEKKSAGVALYQELRRMGLPITEYTPHRGTGDKMARLNSVSDIISSGMVWVPERRWAEELVEELAAFPFGSHDDLVDSTVMALLRFRQGGFITLPTDESDEPESRPPMQEGYY